MSKDTKNQIYQNAIKIFSEKGFEQTSVDEIALKAGIAKGTIYYHFNGKKELFTSLMREGINDLEHKVKKKIGPDTTPLAKLSITIEVMVNFFQENRDFCKILLTEFWGGESRWQDDILKIRGGIIKNFENIIVEGQSQKLIKSIVDPPTYAAGFFGMVAVASLHWALFEKNYPRTKIIATLENSLVEAVKA